MEDKADISIDKKKKKKINWSLEFERDYSEELINFPHIILLIKKFREKLQGEQNKTFKLRKKLKSLQKKKKNKPEKVFVDAETQTDFVDDESSPTLQLDWNTSENKSILDEVTKVAESASQSEFVYEETSGLYYHCASGYYYDSKLGLYYNGNTGTYYYYDEGSNSYKYHSQVHAESTTQKKKRKKKENKDNGKKRKTEEQDDCVIILDENECSDSCSESSDNGSDKDLAKNYPPCMRIIVTETNLTKLKVGSLFVIVYTGGSVGREGNHAVLVPDLNVSKYHASIKYDEEQKNYSIIDLGSRNGTLVNGKRLSVANQESEPCEIVHGSVIQVGCTKLLCHIHYGYETCGHCEPGLVQETTVSKESVQSVKSQHQSELRRLKSKFGVNKDKIEDASRLPAGYQDRANSRREKVGSSTQHAKTEQSSLTTSITKSNMGFKMLSKMGWTEGQSLGKSSEGMTEPVPLVQKYDKAGLGSSNVEAVLEINPNLEKKQAMWRKTQQRYNDLKESE